MFHKKLFKGAKEALLGKPAKTEVRELSLLTPEQQRQFNQELLPRLLARADQRQVVSFSPVDVPVSERVGAIPQISQSPAQGTSLAALAEQARRLATGEAVQQQVDLLSQLSTLFQQQAGQGARERALQVSPEANVAAGAAFAQQQQAQTLSPEAQQALEQMLSGTPQQFEEFFQKAVQEPALQQFNEQVLPMIARQYAAQFFGSDRERADMLAQRELIRALTQARADLAFQAAQEARNRQQVGIQLEQADLVRQAQERVADAQVADQIARTLGQQQLAAGELGQQALALDRQTALAALEQQTGINRQTIADLATIVQVANIPFEQAVKLVGLDLQRVLANADIDARQFEQAIRNEQLGLEAQQLQAAADQNQLQALQLLLQAIISPRKENLVVQKGGRQGLLAPLLGGIGQGIGAAFGGPIGAAIGGSVGNSLGQAATPNKDERAVAKR